MKFILQYTKHAKDDLELIDKKTAKRVIKKIDYFINQDNPIKFSKKLTGPLKGLYRFRIGDWRVIFHKDAKGRITILTILTIKHRYKS